MGLFCVWLKTSTPYPEAPYRSAGIDISQEFIAFVNREAADEWWREISTPPSIHAEHIKRMSPQLYVWYSFNRGTSLAAQSFADRMFSPCDGQHITNSPITITLPSEITDHISGRWYFIRSKADPSSHWYLRTSGTCAVCAGTECDAIHVSRDYRTQFCVRVRDPAAPENFVMIRTDGISITAPRGYSLYIDDAGDLKAKKEDQGETDLLFGDLSDRFITRPERKVNGEVWEYVESVERDMGEPWELA